MSAWKGFVLGALTLALLLVLGALVAVVTGAYDVAASQRHTAVGAWALQTNFVNAVKRNARDIEAPELTPAMVKAGAPEYKAMCAQCHGGVGERRAGWAEGMRPKPPALARAAQDWSAAEVFWLVKHGARMTGMPAFGPTHDDQTVWNIAAFVKAMPTMTARDYAAYPADHGEDAGHSHPAEAAPHAH